MEFNGAATWDSSRSMGTALDIRRSGKSKQRNQCDSHCDSIQHIGTTVPRSKYLSQVRNILQRFHLYLVFRAWLDSIDFAPVVLRQDLPTRLLQGTIAYFLGCILRGVGQC